VLGAGSGARPNREVQDRAGRDPSPLLLVVDDSLADVALLQDVLQELDPQLRVVSRADVPSAREWLAAHVPARPDPGGAGTAAEADGEAVPLLALLCDVRLPGPGGASLVAWVRASPVWCHLPVLMLSTSDHPRDRLACQQAGANDYLCKPTDPAALSARLEAALRQHTDWAGRGPGR